jgi:SAM-dependent methyltransferase
MPEWDELFKKDVFRWKEPHEKVVDFFTLLGKFGNHPYILDLGCGAGRHLVYLGGQGCRVVGSDISRVGLSYSASNLAEINGSSRLVQADMTRLPFCDGSFDALITIHVIFHNPLAGVRQSIAEIFRVLKPGGLALFTFQSTRSYRYGRGVELEPNTFLPDTGADTGVPHHYMDLEEVAHELTAFTIWQLVLEETKDSGYRSSHWFVTTEKPVYSGRNPDQAQGFKSVIG